MIISLSFIFSFNCFVFSLDKFVCDIYPVLLVDDLVPLCLCDPLLFIVNALLTETSRCIVIPCWGIWSGLKIHLNLVSGPSDLDSSLLRQP